MASGLGGTLRTLRPSQTRRNFPPREGRFASIPSRSLIVNEWTYVAFPWKASLGQQCGNVVKGRGTKHWRLSQLCCRL